MFSYLFMKILELQPRSYDARLERIDAGHMKQVRQTLSGYVEPGWRVLEIGCGTGILAVELAKKVEAVAAFDLNPGMIEVARERLVEANLADKVEIFHLSVVDMDTIVADSYDAIFSTLVFSELSDSEVTYALEHSWRILKEGGFLVIADEVEPRTRWGKLQSMTLRLPMLVATYLVSRSLTHPLHEFSNTITHAGFELVNEERSLSDSFCIFRAIKRQKHL